MLAGPTGGFLSVGGSESMGVTGCVVIGSWFSSPAAARFSSEHRRLEGEGLVDACGTGGKVMGKYKSRVEMLLQSMSQHTLIRRKGFLPLSTAGLLRTLLVSASGLLAIGLFVAFGLSASFFCRFSLRARVRSSSF